MSIRIGLDSGSSGGVLPYLSPCLGLSRHNPSSCGYGGGQM